MTRDFSYDFESRLTTISVDETPVATYAYNGLDTRVSKTENSVTSTYRRDGVYVTDPVLSDNSATYTPGLSERRSNASTFFHSGIKNTHEQTSANEASAATRQYDAFGNVTTSSGTWKSPFGYAGGFSYQEDASELKLLGYRYYDSSTGRFLTRDPLKDGRNWYGYCENNPVSNWNSCGVRPVTSKDRGRLHRLRTAMAIQGLSEAYQKMGYGKIEAEDRKSAQP